MQDVLSIGQFHDFILQESSVCADVPFPVIVVDDIGIQRDFPATVGHGTDILLVPAGT